MYICIYVDTYICIYVDMYTNGNMPPQPNPDVHEA